MTETLTALPVSKALVPPNKLWHMTEEQRRRGPAATQVKATGQHVCANVTRLRKVRGLTTYQLAKLMADAGRPIPQSGISRIESGARRVDVDDLTALAVVFGVSPSALLLPIDVDEHDEVQITGSTPVAAVDAWRWADGQAPLTRFGQGTQGTRDYMRTLMEFSLYGRPHWLVEMEEERANEHSRAVAELYKRDTGADGPPVRSVPLDRLLSAAGFEAHQRADGTIEVRPRPGDGGTDG
ncbi:helix-turn-helix domain-containing protein [Streptomyces sp. C10-9-1]|uniref:helix-turn-helix domain-containing protein n=1 Tax=Streptomyces sp. C10-9-1 TaxID=1859285 RepID=UPI003D7273EB